MTIKTNLSNTCLFTHLWSMVRGMIEQIRPINTNIVQPLPKFNIQNSNDTFLKFHDLTVVYILDIKLTKGFVFVHSNLLNEIVISNSILS